MTPSLRVWGRRWRGVWWVAACASSALIACTAAPGATFGSGLSKVPADSAVQAEERAMFDRLNRDRAKQKLAALRFDARLSDIARHHSADMRDHGFFEHASPRTGNLENRLDAAGYLFLRARENLSEAPDVEQSEDGLLASPHHYENIMADDITHVGIGIVHGGVQDPRNLTVTQVFAAPVDAEPPARAESELIRRMESARSKLGAKPAQRDTQLGELAAHYIAELDEAGSSASVERVGQGVASALEGKRAARLSISAQVVPSSAQFSFPDPLLHTASCAYGLAARRVSGAQGRPSLQVLLIVLEAVQ